MQQNILGMKNIRIFQMEDEMTEGNEQIGDKFLNLAIRAGRIQSMYMPTAPNLLTLAIALVSVYGTNLILGTALT